MAGASLFRRAGNKNKQKAVLKALSEQDETADICLNKKGNPEPDTSLRDNENVPLKEDIREYFEREVLPHVPDAWIDESKTVKGYEKLGFILTKNVKDDRLLEPIKKGDIQFEKIKKHGTSIIMKEPHYGLNKHFDTSSYL